MKKTITDYLTVLLGTGVGRGIALLNSIIIARTLGKEDFGKFTIFFVIMVLTWIFPQAFDSVFVRYAKTSSDENEKNEFLRVSFFLKLVYSITAIVIAYPLSRVLAVVFFGKPEIGALIVWAIISGVFQAFLMTIASIFQEKEKFNIFSILYASYTFSILLALGLLRAMPEFFNLDNVIAVHVLVSILIGSASIFLLLKRKIKRVWPLNRHCMEKSIALGKWVFGSAIVGFAFARVDTFLLPRYISFETLGIYGVAQQVTMLISVLSGSLSNVFLPKACAAVSTRESLKRYIKESFVLSFMILIIILVLILFAGKAIHLLYGSEYLSAQGVVRILLIGWLFNILFVPLSALFYAFDNSKSRFFVDAFRFCSAILLLVYLIPRYKEMGAAWGMTIAQFLSCIVSFCVLIFIIKRKKWS